MAKHNIFDFNQLYRRSMTEKAGASSPHKLSLERVAAGSIRVLSHVTVENKTNDYTKCRLAIDSHGITHYLDELGSPTADELAVSRSDIILGEGDVFFAEITGATENDDLRMTCTGWENKLK